MVARQDRPRRGAMADSTVPNPTAPMSKTNSTPRIACQRVPATERVIVAADASGLADESELDESTRRRCRRADQRHGQCGHDDHRLGDCPPSIPRARHRRPSPYPSPVSALTPRRARRSAQSPTLVSNERPRDVAEPSDLRLPRQGPPVRLANHHKPRRACTTVAAAPHSSARRVAVRRAGCFLSTFCEPTTDATADRAVVTPGRLITLQVADILRLAVRDKQIRAA